MMPSQFLRFGAILSVWAVFLAGGGVATLALAQATDAAALHIKARSGFRFDPVRLRVAPGQRVTMTVENVDQMMHNLVIVKPGSREDVVKTAAWLGSEAVRQDFIPRTDAVLFATTVLSPGDSQTITFTAPSKPGVYPYVCTYPGHGFAMYGALYVTRDVKLPPADKDPHLPPKLPSFAETGARFLHPHHGAVVVREFMPDCGPAAIAIGFPNGESACWDAGACRLRYAWSGGFISVPYRKHDRATLLGEVYYRTPVEHFPLRIGSLDRSQPKVEFLGYRLIKMAPEFAYRVDGVLVREYVQMRPTKEPGVQRTFVVASEGKPVWFVADPKLARRVSASTGTWDAAAGVLTLSPKQAQRFAITIAPPDPFAEEEDLLSPQNEPAGKEAK